MKNKKFVLIGGGTGSSVLLSGLKKLTPNITAIVSTSDDGGSNFKIRKDFGIIPPSDLRQCLLALANVKGPLLELFNYRFSKGDFSGHTTGNIIFAALSEIYSSPEVALEELSKLLNITGEVLPVTLKPTILSAVLENGKKIVGEHLIDEPSFINGSLGKPSKIKELTLTPNVPVNPKVLAAIKTANVIIFGPGDLFTSTIPNLLVKGVKEEVNKSKAKKVLVTNLMTKHGQTDGFAASDFVKVLEQYLNGKIDYVLTNNKKPSKNILKKYTQEKAKFVEADVSELARLKVESIIQNFISNEVVGLKKGDVLKRSMIRHESNKLAKIIWHIAE
jgi:uncharacterized cofD-like protein